MRLLVLPLLYISLFSLDSCRPIEFLLLIVILYLILGYFLIWNHIKTIKEMGALHVSTCRFIDSHDSVLWFHSISQSRASRASTVWVHLGWAGSSCVARSVSFSSIHTSISLIYFFSNLEIDRRRLEPSLYWRYWPHKLLQQSSAAIHQNLMYVYKKIESTNPISPGFNHCLTTLRPPGQNRYTVPTAKRIIKQILLALDYLPCECGYIHTHTYDRILSR